jgi:hypothetical protein
MGDALSMAAPPMQIGSGLFLEGGRWKTDTIQQMEFHLDEDVIHANPNYWVNKLPNLKKLILRSGSRPSLYTSTPNVMKHLACKLTHLDVQNVNTNEFGVLSDLSQSVRHEFVMIVNWNQLLALHNWNASFLTNLNGLLVHVNMDNVVTDDSLMLLHTWVQTNRRNLLHVYIKNWTIAMDKVFLTHDKNINANKSVLHEFFLLVESIEPAVWSQLGEKRRIWSQFVSAASETNAELSMKFSNATPDTLPWFQTEMLRPFVNAECRSIVSNIQLDYTNLMWNDSIKHSVDTFISTFVDWSANAIMKQYNLDLHGFVEPSVDALHKYTLNLFIQLPKNNPKIEFKHKYYPTETPSDDELKSAIVKLKIRKLMMDAHCITLNVSYTLEAVYNDPTNTPPPKRHHA